MLGIWLVLSPWALAYAGEVTAAWNAYVVGAIVAVAAFAALIAFQVEEQFRRTLLLSDGASASTIAGSMALATAAVISS